VKRSFLISDLVWLALGGAFCLGGLQLGFGSFRQPHAGFMPVLTGVALALLAGIDLAGGLLSGWAQDKRDTDIWADINAGKLLVTAFVLLAYTLLFTTLGFVLATIPLLAFLFRLMQARAWWVVLSASVGVAGLFYLGFKFGLECQLPQGLFWF
jgi:hypothetical protein